MNHIDRIKKIKCNIIDIAASAVGCHLGGSLSVVDILYVAYLKFANDVNSKIILSKGHAAAALYAILYEFGILEDNPSLTYGKKDSLLTGHPNHKLKGISFSTGSLGHGVAYAAGWALAQKLQGTKGYGIAIAGDGELQEGLCWETFQFVQSKQLNNYICIVDINSCQNDGYVADISPINFIEERFKAFGFIVKTVDGHNIDELIASLNFNNQPLVILAKTIKGNGIKILEGESKSHYVKITNKKALIWKSEL